MTLPHQIRQRRKALHSFTGRYGFRWTVVSKSAKSCQGLLLQYYTISFKMKLVSRSPSQQHQNCLAPRRSHFHQALKGVHYESGSQKCRQEDAAHDKQEDSSSSEKKDDDEEEDEGAVTRIKPLKKKHKKWCETTDESEKHVTPKSFHHNSLPSGSSTPTSSSLFSKFPNFLFQAPVSQFQTILSKLKSHIKFKIQSISNYFQ